MLPLFEIPPHRDGLPAGSIPSFDVCSQMDIDWIILRKPEQLSIKLNRKQEGRKTFNIILV
jgi:hypothetical protein